MKIQCKSLNYFDQKFIALMKLTYLEKNAIVDILNTVGVENFFEDSFGNIILPEDDLFHLSINLKEVQFMGI